MRLDEFIRDSMVQILDGVRLARESRASSSGGVCPKHSSWKPKSEAATGFDKDGRPIFLADFDVAVVPLEEGGVGLVAEPSSGPAFSRVRFPVPFSYPESGEVL